MGDKFGNVTANRNKSDYGSNKFIVNDSDSSLDIMNTNKAAPYLRKGFSCDPEKANRNQKEILRKLKFEKAEKDYDMFETFTKSEQIELSKLDFLTQTFLFLRKYITNPIISCDEIDIKYAVKDFLWRSNPLTKPYRKNRKEKGQIVKRNQGIKRTDWNTDYDIQYL